MRKVIGFLVLILTIISTVACGEHEHSYLETVVSPTCEQKGYTSFVCSCGESYQDNFIDALGHSYSEWTTITDSTEDEEGLKTRTCSICNKVDEEKIERKPHTHKYSVETVAPTCIVDGYNTEICPCGDIKSIDIIKATGHSFGEWIIETEASSTNDGLKYRECSVCLEKEEEIIPGGSHKHNYKITIIESTCKEYGYTLYECDCGYSYQTIHTSLKEHSYGEWVVMENPTDTENGLQQRVCSACGYVNEEIIPSNNHEHSYSDWSLFESNAVGGVKVKTCSGCGGSIYEDFVFTDPNYTIPTGLELTYGETIDTLVLPNGFEISEEQELLFNSVGVYTIYLNYTDQTQYSWLYNKVYRIEASITIKPVIIDVNIDLII